MKTIALLTLLSFSLFAFKFSPMSLELESSGQKSRGQYYLENDSKETIAIELQVAKRKMNLEGKETRKIDKKSFQVFPPQLILKPGEKKSVRVIWKGKNSLDVEKAFRLIAAQVPLEFDKKKKGSGIKILLKYVAGLYVLPQTKKENVIVQNSQVKKNKIQIKIHNKGNVHKILDEIKLELKGKDKSYQLSKNELKGIQGENVLAQSKRLFTIDLPKSFESTRNPQVEFEIVK